jgi:hypothetical protein
MKGCGEFTLWIPSFFWGRADSHSGWDLFSPGGVFVPTESEGLSWVKLRYS